MQTARGPFGLIGDPTHYLYYLISYASYEDAHYSPLWACASVTFSGGQSFSERPNLLAIA